MNKWKIEIKNYQALKDVKLELQNGITIITGRTNQGKSSIIRAIDAALFNNLDDNNIKSGEETCSVKIDNGLILYYVVVIKLPEMIKLVIFLIMIR